MANPHRVAHTDGVFDVQRVGGGVTIADTIEMNAAHTLPIGQAQELVTLLGKVLDDEDSSRGLIGSVKTSNGRELHVKHSGHHVSLDELRDGHSGWTLRLVDQVEALRDAFISATTGGLSK